jgi:two-component system, chemotaxis family, protein-glutamate methylesterase/glutaminase
MSGMKNVHHEQALILFGTSTGGPQALTMVFEQLPVLANTSCCIVQHMPAGFTTHLAKRLHQVSKWHVKEAVHGEPLEPGVAYLAPGGSQMSVQAIHGKIHLHVEQSGPVGGHQPSVDVLFMSAARYFAGPIIAVLMTGMGKDGAMGLKVLHSRGAYTIAQDEQSCVVYGMPRAAVLLNAVDSVVPLARIHEEITTSWSQLTMSMNIES